jgi:ubiquitin-protein ligase
MNPSPRQRRLRNDLKAMKELRGESSIFRFTSYGDPPEKYLVTFAGLGLKLNPDEGVVTAGKHQVRVVLGADYPRIRPDLRWVSPVFHPNISESGLVCLGGYTSDWVPSLTIDRLCTMLWDMVRWANYDVRSPYNLRAAQWAKVQTDYTFPVDARQIRDRPGLKKEPKKGARRAGKLRQQGIVFLDE